MFQLARKELFVERGKARNLRRDSRRINVRFSKADTSGASSGITRAECCTDPIQYVVNGMAKVSSDLHLALVAR